MLSCAKVVNELSKKPKLGAHDNISWSAHFATLQDASRRPPAISGLMPLFHDNAHSLALVKHGMDVIAKATEYVNRGKVPVLTADQPLFAIAKKIPWSWLDVYGDSKYCVMRGGLHIEIALLNALGHW